MKTFDDYFEIIKFASPETNVRLKNSDEVPKTDQIILKRCMNWEDIMHLICADSILAKNDIFCQWYIPYKPFARQDRTTALTHANESKILNRLFSEFHQFATKDLSDRIIFLDVHSSNESFGACINQFIPIRVLHPFNVKDKTADFGDWDPGFHLIVPDKGAKAKIPKWFTMEITYCDKKRDPVTGKLTDFIVPPIKTNRPMVLIDDICDGGGTFIGIAKKLQEYRKKNTLTLYVTHGLFTKGIAGVCDLLNYFDSIVTTNSVLPTEPIHMCTDKLKIIDVTSDLFMDYALTNLTRYQ